MHEHVPFDIHDVERIVLRILLRAQLFECYVQHSVAGVEIGGFQGGKLGPDVIHENGAGRRVIEKEHRHSRRSLADEFQSIQVPRFELGNFIKTGPVPNRQPLTAQFDQSLASQKLQRPVHMHGRKPKGVGKLALRQRKFEGIARSGSAQL
jgi:hypothetical protein